MDSRAPLIAAIVLIAAMEAVSLIAWLLLPDAPIAVHFDIDGNPDRFAPPWLALSIMPLAAIFVTLLFAVLPRLGAREGNRLLARSQAWAAVWIGTVLVLGVAHMLIVLKARGMAVDIGANVIFITALLLMVAGNFLGKMPPNDWAGIRTPWTRSSDYAWEKTNRLGGWIMAGAGFASLVAIAAAGRETALYVMMVGIAGLLLLIPLSWHYWKHDPER